MVFIINEPRSVRKAVSESNIIGSINPMHMKTLPFLLALVAGHFETDNALTQMFQVSLGL